MLEVVHQVCGEMVREGRERLVMVDIDNVFLAPDERRMTRDDVKVCVCVCVCVSVCVCVCVFV